MKIKCFADLRRIVFDYIGEPEIDRVQASTKRRPLVIDDRKTTPKMDIDKESVRQLIGRLDIINLHEQLNKQHKFFKKKKSPENK